MFIPWPLGNRPDKLIWSLEKHGFYTVKSGYWLATKLSLEACASPSFSEPSWWSILWKLNLPPKVKLFAWRLASNWLPTMINLQRHG